MPFMTTPSTLPALLERRAPGRDLHAFLDDIGHDGRVQALSALGRAEQRLLYESAAGAEPLGLDDFVPSTRAPLVPVPHHGFNTLPLPAAGRSFVKRMVRQGDGTVIGWNDSPFAWLIGPGYFTLRPTVGDEQQYGGVVVDYYLTPDGPKPDGWPWIRPNWLGLQALVYGWCHDYMRRVSSDVTIGAAWKWGRPVGSWFALTRGPDAG